MSKVVINIESHEQKYTVSEMRRRLAQVLSKLDGGQEVSFNFTATLENYQATPQARAITMHPALGAPYSLSPTGLAAYASRMANATTTHQIEAEENQPDDPYVKFAKREGSPRPHKIYDPVLERETGFGVFPTERAAHGFLMDIASRNPALAACYEVRDVDD